MNRADLSALALAKCRAENVDGEGAFIGDLESDDEAEAAEAAERLKSENEAAEQELRHAAKRGALLARSAAKLATATLAASARTAPAIATVEPAGVDGDRAPPDEDGDADDPDPLGAFPACQQRRAA